MTSETEQVLAATTVVLDDGRHIAVRTLDADDAHALEAALEAADHADLYRRFLGVPPPSHVLLTRLRAADGSHDLALGAFTDTGQLIAVAQFDRRGDGLVAEVAIEVARPWQRAGLGRILLERLVQIARAHGVQTFAATFFADNVAVRRLLTRLGSVLESPVVAGVCNVRVDIRDASRLAFPPRQVSR